MAHKNRSTQDLFTVVPPENLWVEFKESEGIFRCGRSTHPALKNLRLGKDLTFAVDPFAQEKLIVPNNCYGISFADSLATLKSQPVRGVAWIFPRGQTLPDGLVFNYRDKWHPLLNVSRPMTESKLLQTLNRLADMMRCTNMKV